MLWQYITFKCMILGHMILLTILMTEITCYEEMCPCTSKLLRTSWVNSGDLENQKKPQLIFSLNGTKYQDRFNIFHNELKVSAKETIRACKKLKKIIEKEASYKLCTKNNENLVRKSREGKRNKSLNWTHTITIDFDSLVKQYRNLADIAKNLEAEQTTGSSKNIPVAIRKVLNHINNSLCRLEFVSYYTESNVTCDVSGDAIRRHHRAVHPGYTSCTRLKKQRDVVQDSLQVLEQLNKNWSKDKSKNNRGTNDEKGKTSNKSVTTPEKSVTTPGKSVTKTKHGRRNQSKKSGESQRNRSKQNQNKSSKQKIKAK